MYILLNAATHEIIDIAISNKKAKCNKNNKANEDRFFNIIKRVYLSLSLGKKIVADSSILENKGPDIDKEEEMTLLELKLNREIENESLNCKKII